MRSEGFYALSSDMIEAFRGIANLVAPTRRSSSPISVLFGTENAILNLQSLRRGLHYASPTNKLTLIPGAGHMLQVTEPEKTAAWIRTTLSILSEVEGRTECAERSRSAWPLFVFLGRMTSVDTGRSVRASLQRSCTISTS